jgi:hypothetical protein
MWGTRQMDKFKTSFNFDQRRLLAFCAVLAFWNLMWPSWGTLVVSIATVTCLMFAPFRTRLQSIILGLAVGSVLTHSGYLLGRSSWLHVLGDQNLIAGVFAGALAGDVSWRTNEKRVHGWGDRIVVVIFSVGIWLFFVALLGSASNILEIFHKSKSSLGYFFEHLGSLTATLHAFIFSIASLPAAIAVAMLPTRRFVVVLSTALVLIPPTLVLAFGLSAAMFIGPIIVMMYLWHTKAIFLFIWALITAAVKFSTYDSNQLTPSRARSSLKIGN